MTLFVLLFVALILASLTLEPAASISLIVVVGFVVLSHVSLGRRTEDLEEEVERLKRGKAVDSRSRGAYDNRGMK